uniref:ESPR-type extended signal peptide-containing protein n=1 Tax=uncultured Mitsuokella sp. TaxID=453120 RepID=UPI0025D1B526
MNRIYKVIYSKAHQCYIVVSELAKRNHKSSQPSIDHSTPALARIIALALTAGALTWGSTPGISWAANNTAGSGDGVAVGTGSSAPKAENVAIGKGATISYSGGVGQPSTGDIVIGGGAHINNYIDQGGGIAIGANSFVENMTGGLERSFDFKQAGYFIIGGEPRGLPWDPTKMVTGVAVGQNTYARSGSIMLGTHNYKGDLGDVTVDSANTKAQNMSLFSTTLGANSYSNGLFSSVTGAYSIASSDYSGGEHASKNFGATITGSLNSIESATSSNEYSGVANSIVGLANRTSNSNGSLIFGAGNEIKNSITDISAPTSGGDSSKALQDSLMKAVQDSESGGATLAIGGGNKADYTQKTSIIGVNNSVVGEKSSISSYNSINGFKNTVTNASHVKVLGQNVTINKGADSNTVIGDYRTVAEGQTHNVIIGNADETAPITTEKKDTVILGHNANATIDGGVALGAGSVAAIDKDQIGYDPANGEHQTDTTGTWKSTAAAVSVGDASKKITRQITNVAAGSEDTDAVNVAQLKAISNTVDASKTKYYSVNDSAPGAIFDNEEFEKHYTNKNNDGAKSYYAMAAGYGTYAAGDASTVIGSYSVIQNDKVKDGDDEDLSPQGATAVSVGSFNFNLNTPIKSSNDFSKWYSGTANSIVGQGNLTKDSNGVLIYGAGNKITNSYRGDVPINMLAASMNSENSDVYQNPESFTDKVGEAVLQSGGQVMAIGGGNVADKAYMTQLMGVGNKVQGADITFTPPELQDDEENYERYITAFNSAFNKQATRLNYVDGFYNNLTNAKNDYVIGMANDISGDDVSSNKSNIVIGDFHQMKNGSNNIILGSQDGKLTQKRYNTDGTLGTKESVNRFTHQEKLADAVMIGHNADVLKNGGVALGADSIASTEAGIAGFDPQSRKHVNSEKDYSTWVSTDAAVSVGGADHEVKYKDKEGKEQVQIVKSTRQITNVAAGKEDTDAVNVAQLKAISSTMNTDIAASKTHFYSVKSTDAKAKNYNNDGATAANALAAGVGANADKASAVAIGDTAYAGSANGVAIGTGSWIRSSDGKPNANGGDVAIGQDSHVDSYVNQGGSIALGQNARVENMYGNTEKSWALGQTKFDDKNIPLNPGNEAGGIAIGRNSFARTGSLMVGSHMYKGAIADIDEVDGTDSQKLRENFNNINMTTLGTNSFNNGTFATVTGAYSATTAKKKIQNFAATVDGSLNSIESYKDAADNSGVASSIVGTANRIANSNNTTILGAGNEVTNSLTDITAPTEGGASAKALQDTLKGNLQQDTKGAVVVSGIGNTVDSSHGVSVLGSRNVVKTTDNIQLLGDNREVAGANGSVIIGSADSKMTTSVTDATILGHNANVEKAGGVALGAGSVASREASVAGYDPATKTDSTDSSATWKATDAAVSVGKADGTMTRQITGVAAGTEATDAVNVAQLQKALSGAKDGNDTLKSDTNALTLNGNTLSMNVEDTAGHKVSGSVDLSKFAQAVDTNTTYTLTGEANPDNNTTTITLKDSNGNKNSVTVATKDTDTRNTVKAGENVTLDTKDNSDGSHEYTVNVKADGKVEAGSTKIV